MTESKLCGQHAFASAFVGCVGNLKYYWLANYVSALSKTENIFKTNQ